MKHYLGLNHTYSDRRRVLIYVFWEPTNAGALSEYKDHRREISRDDAGAQAQCPR